MLNKSATKAKIITRQIRWWKEPGKPVNLVITE